MIKVGIIGGTGLGQDSSFLEDITQIPVTDTPYGSPSDSVIISGKIANVDVIIIGRHGKNHNVNPSNVNYRANLWLLKQQKCTHVLVTTACGSLENNIKPGSFCILNQYIDRTKGYRKSSFYNVCHVSQAHPFDLKMQELLEESLKELNFPYCSKATTVTIEGPRFSTVAESKLYQSWNCQVVNMTTVPEAQLAAELGLVYSAIALVTDYDVWHENKLESVNVDLVTQRLIHLSVKAKQVIVLTIQKVSKVDWSKIIETKEKDYKIALMCSEKLE